MKNFESITIKDATFQDIVNFVNDHIPYCSGDFKLSISTKGFSYKSEIFIDIDYEGKTISIYNHDFEKSGEVSPMNFEGKKC